MLNLYPLNDFAATVKLETVDSGSGVKTPLTTGTVTAFIATSDSNTAVAADPTLSVNCTHISNGKWLVFFDASALQVALLTSLFATVKPYLIIQQVNALRVYAPLTYTPNRPASL